MRTSAARSAASSRSRTGRTSSRCCRTARRRCRATRGRSSTGTSRGGSTRRAARKRSPARAANAPAAVANYAPDQFYAFHSLLYGHQPAEGSTGLTDDQLISYAKQAKVTNIDAITNAIRNKSFSSWVKDSTDRFLTAKFPLTNVQSEADI